MSLYLLVLFCFALGLLLKNVRLFGAFLGETLTPLLNSWIINLALPALILSTVPGLEFSTGFLFALLAPWSILAIVYAASFVLARRLGWSNELRIVVVLMLSLGNTAFLGVPLVRHQMDQATTLAAIVYDQLGSFLILSLIATALIASVSRTEKSTLLGRILIALRFPPFIALVVAIVLSFFPQAQASGFWEVLAFLLDACSQTLLPLAMVVIGLRFQFRFDAKNLSPLLLILGGKLVLFPLLVLAFAVGFGIAPQVAVASVVQAAMPPMVTGVILCIRARVEAEFATTALGLGTLLSALTLPLWFFAVSFYPELIPIFQAG